MGQDWYAVVALGFLSALGASRLALGLAGAFAPGSTVVTQGRRHIVRELEKWDGVSPGERPAEIDILVQRFVRLNGWSLMGAGLGVLAASAVSAWLALTVPGALDSLFRIGLMVTCAVYYQAFTLGMTLGYLAGSRVVTRVMTGPVWADLRRRRLGDYRAGWVGWGPFALAGLALAGLAVVAVTQPRIVVDIAGERRIWPTLPVVAALALWAALVPVLATLLARWIVASPRALVADDLVAARAADEMRRAVSIGLVTSYAWISSGLTLIGMVYVTSTGLVTTGEAWVGALMGILLLLGALANFFGLGLTVLRGRLGGRVTGGSPTFASMVAVLKAE